jgi:hypothetical protein
MLNGKMDSFNVQEILSQLLLEYYNKVSVSQAPILTGAVLPPLDGQLHPLPGPMRVLHEMVHVLTASTGLITLSRNLILTNIPDKKLKYQNSINSSILPVLNKSSMRTVLQASTASSVEVEDARDDSRNNYNSL